jgi:hypothetical protein
MLTGKRFRLGNPTLALEMVDGKRVAVTVPTGAIIRVISGPNHDGEDRMLKVLWQGKTVTMFALDVDMRGTEITDRSATA